ncbi:MAG: hypothetical protein ACKO0M_10235 [Cyanobium sp.]
MADAVVAPCNGMAPPLVFVIAAAAALPQEACTPAALEQAQRQGPRGGFALRLYSLGREASATGGGAAEPDLALLPLEGSPGNRSQLICDATIPHLEPRSLWMGVYQAGDAADGALQCLDRFPLSEASNETCWFYPTHDGAFLSWERGLRLVLGPGGVADAPDELLASPYDRGRLAVLWSLLGDDASLTCVGLTYGGLRIDFPLLQTQTEPMATWSRFRVDSQAEVNLEVLDSRSVFEPGASGPVG